MSEGDEFSEPDDAGCVETPADLIALYEELEAAGAISPGIDVSVTDQLRAQGVVE